MLHSVHPTLPSPYYHDPVHYGREIETIWGREWILLAHAGEWGAAGDYRVFRIGDQQLIVCRTGDGSLRAFHNTCRHRGSLLCRDAAGTFRNRRIVCPYHAWVYSLEGELQRTPRRVETADFDPADYSLYGAHLEVRRGLVFANLAGQPAQPLDAALGAELDCLANWPLERLAPAHRESHQVACNWKVFWENFQECYHCPGVHPDLCRVVPMYREGCNALDDLPADSPLRDAPGTLAEGMVTWSEDGQTPLPVFVGLTGPDRDAGMTFATSWPGGFVVGHADYVRTVHVLPLGPERTQLTVTWFLLPETLAGGDVDVERLTSFGRRVVLEDAQACELNQLGLKCRRHEHGVLVPQEYGVLDFQRWVLERLGEAG